MPLSEKKRLFVLYFYLLLSRAVIGGYPSEQDGAILPARDYQPCPARKIPRKPYNKSFIDQAGKMNQNHIYWPHSFFFFCEFIDLNSVSVHKHAKNELGQYPAILTSRLVNNPYLFIYLFFTIDRGIREQKSAHHSCLNLQMFTCQMLSE